MPDAQDLHQIEYRHHQTRDLSPVATSMPSPESVRGWDSRIRAWVRHPHADRLSESVCYQLLSNAQAALAWRYWDQRAAERADGTRGRPLVSRVLVGQDSVLTPDVAVALCRYGLPDSAGPMPGEVPDDAKLPTVSSDELTAMIREKTPELDQCAAQQDGLQAVVAAALADSATPLAISIQDVVIQRPLREGVQYPLLWGLLRIVGPLFGPAGRGWSFSTFEPPLGEMDPASLPGVVFRQAQDGVQPPPVRWRKEVKIRPFAPDALNPGLPYSGQVELAGWLVTRYRERGGKALQQFITECCGSERSLQVRLERIHDQLRDTESPVTIDRDSVQFVDLSAGSAPAGQEPEPAAPDLAQPERDMAGEPSRSEDKEPAAQEPAAGEPDGEAPEPENTAACDVPEDTAAADAGSRAVAGEPQPAEASDADPGGWDEDPEVWQQDPGAWGPGSAAAVAAYQEAGQRETVMGAYGDPVHPGYQETWRGEVRPPAWADDRARSLAPSKEGQAPLPLQVPDRSGQRADTRGMLRPAERRPSSQQFVTVSYLLKQLELMRTDPEQFNAILQRIFQISHQPNDSNDRVKSWGIISSNDWYKHVTELGQFHMAVLAQIFGIVVIPDLAEPGAAEKIVAWAYHAPPPMIGGLLAAAQKASSETWQNVMNILEPVLAARWTADFSIRDQWDASRAMRAAGELGSGDSKRSVLGRFRRH